MIIERLGRAADELGPLDGPAATAELLVACAHEGRDRDVWGGDRAITYWDRLPERVRASCYRGPTLGHWWEAISVALGVTQPRRAEDRAALAKALTAEPGPVLDTLRTRSESICLRVRLAIQLDRDTTATTTPQEAML